MLRSVEGCHRQRVPVRRDESSVRMKERRAICTHDSLAYGLTRCAWHPFERSDTFTAEAARIPNAPE